MKAAAQHRIIPMFLSIAILAATAGVTVAFASAASATVAMAEHATTAPSPTAGPSVNPVRTVAARRPDRRVRRRGVVQIKNFKFTPATVTIRAGMTVTWTNRDVVGHTVNFHAAGINSPSVLNQGDTFSHTFTTPGTYAYICDIHPFMHGTVVVTP